ncbi:hypothetical protein SDC9_190237 [bioreactor metagenome]|uniref:Uncharacterized protein n=1 Tax=bioreactor metagenome TaxID=1076179 RepID=A0A645HUZ9_9ZZZZ
MAESIKLLNKIFMPVAVRIYAHEVVYRIRGHAISFLGQLTPVRMLSSNLIAHAVSIIITYFMNAMRS